MKTTKSEVMEAGKQFSSRSTPQQQEKHSKVIAWIETLNPSEILDYSHHAEGREAGAALAYKMMIRTWMDVTKASKN